MRFENICPKSEVSLPLQIGGPKITYFQRLRNLTANLTAYMFRTKHDVGLHSRASALKTVGRLLVSKLKIENVINFGSQTA